MEYSVDNPPPFSYLSDDAHGDIMRICSGTGMTRDYAIRFVLRLADEITYNSGS